MQPKLALGSVPYQIPYTIFTLKKQMRDSYLLTSVNFPPLNRGSKPNKPIE